MDKQPHQPKEASEFVDYLTSILMIVDQNNPEYPGHPKITVICPPDRRLSVEAINAALSRLRSRAEISAEQFPDLRSEEIH